METQFSIFDSFSFVFQSFFDLGASEDDCHFKRAHTTGTDAPKTSQNGAKTDQGGANTLQDGAKTLQEDAKTVQERQNTKTMKTCGFKTGTCACLYIYIYIYI